MKDFEVEHIETALVEAEDRSEALVKAVEGDTVTGWSTEDHVVKDSVGAPSDHIRVKKIREIIERFDDLEDEEMDMDSAITLIRDIVDDRGDI